MLENIVCKQCGKEFSAYKSQKRKYCSKKCGYESIKKLKIIKHCKKCNKKMELLPYQLRNKNGRYKYCSIECRNEGRKKRIVKYCKSCGKKVERHPSRVCNSAYCSIECRRNRVRKRCITCKKEFVVKFSNKNKKYCSKKCYNDSSKKEKITKYCQLCNKKVYLKPHLVKQKYCSKKCFFLAKRIKIKCKFCHKEFETPRHRHAKYCSRKCSSKDQVKRCIKKCLNCNKEIKVIPSQIYRKKFCSKKCYTEHMIENGINSNENNPAWQGGISFEPYSTEWTKELREQIRERDQYRCQECFRHQSELKRKLSVHHIDFNKKNNVPNNLIALCPICHGQTQFNRENWIDYYQKRIEGLL